MTASSELPEGWTLAPIGDLAKFINGDRGKNYPNREALVPEGVPFVNAGHIIDDSIDFSNVNYIPEERFEILRSGKIQKDDLLYCIRGSLGKCAAVDQDVRGAIASSLVILRPKGSVAREYLRYCFKGPTGNKMIEALDNSTAQPNISAKSMAKYKVPVPPLNEQRRIVAKIEELTARSRNAKQALDAIPPLLERFRQSVLAAAFRGDLTKQWRQGPEGTPPNTEPASELLKRIRQERRHRWEQDYLQTQKAKGKEPKDDKWKQKYQEPEPVDTTDLPELPEGWCWAPVELISSKVSDGVHKKPNYIDSGVPFITVRNMTAGSGIDFDNVKYISQEAHEDYIKRTHPEKGDILISKDGTLGVVRRVEDDRVFSIFVSVALVKPMIQEISRYLEYAFQMPQVQEQMSGTGTGLQHIHLRDLRAVVLPLPPLDEQIAMVDILAERLASVANLGIIWKQMHDNLPRLNQSILAKAFRGELVPQDPNDEPASALLERIRSQQNTSAKR